MVDAYTFDAALLCSSRAGSDLGRMSDVFEELCQLGFLIPKAQCFSEAREGCLIVRIADRRCRAPPFLWYVMKHSTIYQHSHQLEISCIMLLMRLSQSLSADCRQCSTAFCQRHCEAKKDATKDLIRLGIMSRKDPQYLVWGLCQERIHKTTTKVLN